MDDAEFAYVRKLQAVADAARDFITVHGPREQTEAYERLRDALGGLDQEATTDA
jgi:hypothetical protein